MAPHFSFFRSLPKLGLLLVVLIAGIGVHAETTDGEIDCGKWEFVGKSAMVRAIASLVADPDIIVCAFNDGSRTEGFPDHFDLDNKAISMPQDDLRTVNQGWTRAGDCKQPGGNAGIWLQTYRWGAPHFCKTSGEIAQVAQAIMDKCTEVDGNGVEVVRGEMQIEYERWIYIGESDNCGDYGD